MYLRRPVTCSQTASTLTASFLELTSICSQKRKAMDGKLLVFFAAGMSFGSCGIIAAESSLDDEIIDPVDILPSATTPAPPEYLQKWDDWKTWETPEKILKMAPYYKAGYDYDGLPIIVLQYGIWNYRELAHLEEKEAEAFVRHFEQFYRRAENEASANNDAGIVVIIDWDGFALSNYANSRALKLALEVFTSISRLNSAIQYAFDINKSFAAETFTNIAKPFLGTLSDKFEIYGTRMEKWKPALLRKLPKNQLPPQYGGENDWKPAPWI